MIKKLTIVAAVVALALPAVAAAHVTVQPTSATAGAFTRIEVRVPTERDDASTQKVEVELPDGFYFVSYEPVPGWNISTTTEKLSSPVDLFGRQISEQVGRVTFEATDEASGIQPGQFRDFGLSVRMPTDPGTLTFKAVQTYSSGEIVRWIGPPDADEPAPRVELAPAVDTEQVAATESADDSDTDWLSIAALIVGGAALVIGLVALAASRRTRAA